MHYVRSMLRLLPTASLALLIPFFASCDGDSAETLVRNLGINVTGLYQNGGAAITSSQTGAPTTQLDVRQNGDQLEATDNNGIIYKGTVGQATESDASFTLNGQTTVGQEVTISGNINVPVGGNTGTMTGSWIEPSLFGNVAAVATVPTNEPDDDGTDDGSGEDNGGNNGSGEESEEEASSLTISPSSASIGESQEATFMAEDANGTVNWSISPPGGASLSDTTGSSTTVSVTTPQDYTLTATDDSGSATASITP